MRGWAWLVTALGVGVSAPAYPCSRLSGRVLDMSFSDGEVVPANGQLVLQWSHGFGAEAQLAYDVDPEGPSSGVWLEPTSDGSRAGFSVWPLPPAPPGTELHIELWDGFEERALTLVYGDEIDTTPPRPPPAPRLELEPYTVPEDTSCGDAHRGDRVYVRVPTEFDEDAVGYQVTFTTPASPDGFRAGLLTKLRHARLWLMSARTPGTEVCATAQTIDRAGNWSTPSLQTCVYAGEGCAASEGSLPTLALLGAALGLLRRRRRARPTARGQPRT